MKSPGTTLLQWLNITDGTPSVRPPPCDYCSIHDFFRQHMAPNADFIALQNPQTNEYELEYMLDEVAEEASAGNSKQI